MQARWSEAGSSEVSESPTTSLTVRQLERGFYGLRFSPDLEASWRREQFQDRLTYLRVNLVLLAVIIFTIVQLDEVVLPTVAQVIPNLARIGVLVPLLVLGLALTFLQRADVWYPRFMAVGMCVGLLGIAWVGLASWEAGESRVFVRLVIATIAVYFVLGLPFRSALAANLIAIAFYAAIAVEKAMPWADLTHYVVMLLMTNVICAAGAYNLEHARRTAWLDGRLLAETALQDGLTGIPNRRRFDDHLQRVWAQSIRERGSIALLFADIDHFKAFNDRYGHQAGDEALKAVSKVLAHFARRPLDLAARYGGEEFAIVLFDTTCDHALRIGEEIMAAVRELAIPHTDSGAAPVLTISMGIGCVVPVARRSCQGLVQLADQALYAAKDAGRNQARVQAAEYEHMKTGYFRRHMPEKSEPGKDQ